MGTSKTCSTVSSSQSKGFSVPRFLSLAERQSKSEATLESEDWADDDERDDRPSSSPPVEVLTASSILMTPFSFSPVTFPFLSLWASQDGHSEANLPIKDKDS